MSEEEIFNYIKKNKLLDDNDEVKINDNSTTKDMPKTIYLQKKKDEYCCENEIQELLKTNFNILKVARAMSSLKVNNNEVFLRNKKEIENNNEAFLRIKKEIENNVNVIKPQIEVTPDRSVSVYGGRRKRSI